MFHSVKRIRFVFVIKVVVVVGKVVMVDAIVLIELHHVLGGAFRGRCFDFRHLARGVRLGTRRLFGALIDARQLDVTNALVAVGARVNGGTSELECVGRSAVVGVVVARHHAVRGDELGGTRLFGRLCADRANEHAARVVATRLGDRELRGHAFFHFDECAVLRARHTVRVAVERHAGLQHARVVVRHHTRLTSQLHALRLDGDVVVDERLPVHRAVHRVAEQLATHGARIGQAVFVHAQTNALTIFAEIKFISSSNMTTAKCIGWFTGQVL